MLNTKNDTPCIGICSTVYGDDVCRGCKRFYDEIINWNQLELSKKQTIFTRLETLLCQVIQNKIEIIDQTLLKNQLIAHRIPFRELDNPLCWAFHLLREIADDITNSDSFGIRVKDSFRDLSLTKLINFIDDEYYTLSLNYFSQGFK